MPALPTTPVKATRVSPKILVIYALPKVGKTKVASELEGNLILDLEGGSEMYENLRIRIHSAADLDDVYKQIMDSAMAEVAAGRKAQYPYKYITIDTADKLEELCEISATARYKKSVIGSSFKGDSVLELPKGGGYYYLRNEVIEKIDKLATVCDRLIIVAHVKDKLIASKKGDEVTVRDISLTGRLADMVCAKADAIGYLYRNADDNGALWVSFETYEGSIMGARPQHLAGKKFPMDWKTIYID